MDGDDTGRGSSRELGDPVRLRARNDEGSWVLKMTTELREAGIEAGDSVDVDLDWDGDVPMLIAAKVPDDVDPEERPSTRSVIGDENGRWIKPPKELIEPEPRAGGLGIDIETYDNANALVFEPLPMDEMVGLTPIGFEDELEEQDQTEDSETTDGEDASEGPDHAISDENVSAAAEYMTVDIGRLQETLAAIESSVTLEDVHGSDEYEPLELPDKTVLIVDGSEWKTIQEELGLSDDLANAARVAHTQEAEDLVVDHGGSSYRRFSRDHYGFISISDI